MTENQTYEELLDLADEIHTIPTRDIEPHFLRGTCPCNPETLGVVRNGAIHISHHAYEKLEDQTWLNVPVTEQMKIAMVDKEGNQFFQ